MYFWKENEFDDEGVEYISNELKENKILKSISIGSELTRNEYF